MAPSEPTVRRMRESDLERVLAIEDRSFSNPWKADTFQTLLERPGAELWVLEDGTGGLLGYVVAWCILDQGEVANIAVAPETRGKGYAALLLNKILGVAQERGVETLYLEVRVSNRRAVALYEGFGFWQVGVRHAYYEQPREDALVMMLRL